jgi:TP901 family phage tail tape measure protein
VVDAQANIKVNLDSSSALAELKALEKQIQIFNKGLIQGTAEANKFQNNFTTSLIHNINATGQFTASMGKVMTETERFSTALEKNQLSAREYFRYSMASTKSFGKMFGKEFATITKTAEDRVKLLQTRHIELGRSADGAMRAVKIVPTSLDYSKPLTQMQLAIQKQQIFNQLLDTGTTKLLNFGKNTQWAGRQLMVGFTIPLTILGGVAIKTFRSMEEQAIRFKKVYGDMFTGEGETQRALENIQALGKEFTKYGITVADTVKLAADAAAAGNAGKQLEDIVTQTTKLAVLGDLTSEQAFDATIAIQNAFRITGEELANAVNFLNAVENQTVVALDDITEAIPRVASVISVLGGDVKDLAIFMAAMKEGGIQAADGANALKTSLGRLINPTKAAVQTAADLGINLKAIVEENAGDLRTIMLTFAEALKPLDDLSKARLMEKVFGKFQFARMSTLFANLGRSGTQAARAIDLAAQSTESLAMLAESELGVVADSAATKFAASMEQLKVSLIPLGEELIKLITPVVEFFSKLLSKFNDLSDNSKKIITGILVGLGAIGPVVLMGIGLVANGVANLLKFINLLRKGYQSLTMGGKSLGMSTTYLSQAQLESLSVSNNLYAAHERLTDRFALEAGALNTLITKYREATVAATGFMTSSRTQGLFVPGTAGRFAAVGRSSRLKFADGGWVPGTGNKDTVPATLMPGEFVVTKKAAQANPEMLEQMNQGGGTFRSAGTPAFGKMEFRNQGTGSQSAKNFGGYLQTDGLHLRQRENRGEGRAGLRYGGYTILGSTSFNSMTISEDSPYRKILGGGKVEGYPLYREEAKAVIREIEKKDRKDRTPQEKVMHRTLKAEIGKYKTETAWRNMMANRYALAGLAAEGLDPRTKEGRRLQTLFEKTFTKESGTAKNSDQLTTRLTRNADRWWKLGILQDRGMTAKGYRGPDGVTKMSMKERLAVSEKRTMPVSRILAITKNPDLARVQGNYGIMIPKYFRPKYDRTGGVSSLAVGGLGGGRLSVKQSSNVQEKVGTMGKRYVPPAMGRFGAAAKVGTAAAGLFGAAAIGAQAVGRSGGTPAYGEQRVTQAMLTPGEFVVNANATQRFGPQLQEMNAGGFVPRIKGTEPTSQSSNAGARTNPNMQRIYAGAAAMGIGPGITQGNQLASTMSTVNNQVSNFGKTVDASGKQVKRFSSEEIKARSKSIKETNKQLKITERQTRNAALSQKAGKAGMLGFVVSMGAMAVGAATEGKTKETANNVSQIAGMLAMVAYLIPLLINPLVLGGVALAGIAGSFLLYNKVMKDAADKGSKIAQSLGTTSEELKQVSESTGRIGMSAIGERMRSERIKNFTPIDAQFGSGYMESDAGKMLLDQIKEFEKQGIDSSQAIARKLASYVADGLMEASEAQGIIAELGRQFGSTTFAIKLSGQLTELIGVNGANLTADPMLVRVKLVEEVTSSAESFVEQKRQELADISPGGERYEAIVQQKAGIASERSVMSQLASEDARKKAKEEGKNWGQVFWAGIKASWKPEELKREIAGAMVGSLQMGLQFTQQQIDAGMVEYQLKKDQYEEQEKILNAQLGATTDAAKRLEIESEISKLQAQRKRNEESFATNNEKLIKAQRLQLSNLVRDFNASDEVSQKAMLDTQQRDLKEKFKGTPGETSLNKLLKTTEGFKDKSVSLKINALISSDSLSVDNASRLVTMFTDEGTMNTVINRTIRLQGVDGVERALTSLSQIEDADIAANLFDGMSRLDPVAFESANKFLETAAGIPADFFNINDDTANILNPKTIQEAGEDLQKIEEELKDLNKLTGEDRITKILEIVTNDEDFAALQGEVEYFNSLDDVNVKQFLSIFRVIKEDFDPEQARLDFMQSGGTTQSFMRLTDTQDGLQKWWTKNIAVPRAKEFQRLLEDIKTPGMGSEEDPNGRGKDKSLPITVKQLIELRLKGLDPAAASSLDYDTAAKVLNGTIKQQKKAIKLLNEELRESSIRTQLLKSDQEVLSDTLKATTDAIGAYISMIEQTRIRPIEDQIEAFNKLTDAQQDQMEKYQRGLQKLSDKEDEINKIYDERIKAIDKVSDANERSAQRSQRQIGLASALASGDIAAAASAASEITSAEAEYRLEDARAALEERRQQELKNLTIEINGQLYTREQIETNLKNLEEEIYQRTLLVRQEQEKIAAIEKEITAEKEKQRKIQALQQIMSLSEQLKTTVDPTQRALLLSQMGFLGQSIGVSDLSNQGQFTQLGQELGVDLSSMSKTIKTSIQMSEQASLEMITAADQVKKNAKGISKFMNDGSMEAGLALGFLRTLNSSWSNKNTGIAATGTSIRDSMFSAGNSLILGKRALEAVIASGLKSISMAASDTKSAIAADKKATGKAFGGVIERPLGGLIPYMGGGKVLERPLGGLIPYMGGGKVKKYAMGGNVNYKGSTEPAPVRMNLGSMVTGSVAPGLGNLDRVPALLTPGEFVVRKSVAQENMPFLRALNKDIFPKFDSKMDEGSILPVSSTSVTGDTNLYNSYSVNVNVPNTNASPEEIANVVMSRIQRSSMSTVRTTRR